KGPRPAGPPLRVAVGDGRKGPRPAGPPLRVAVGDGRKGPRPAGPPLRVAVGDGRDQRCAQQSADPSGQPGRVLRPTRSAPWARSATSSRTIRTKAGWVPGASARSKARPSFSAVWRASLSRSYLTSMWSETKP